MRVCCRWSVIRGFGLLNRIRCGGFVNPRSSMPTLSAYSSPLASYAEHTSGFALLDAGALCHPPPLPAPSRQPAFNESKLPSRPRNFNHANRVRELSSTCDGRSAALKLCVVVSGIKLRWCLRMEDPEYFHKIPSMKDAGERHDLTLISICILLPDSITLERVRGGGRERCAMRLSCRLQIGAFPQPRSTSILPDSDSSQRKPILRSFLSLQHMKRSRFPRNLSSEMLQRQLGHQ
jgi:hypothetical protein